MSRIIRECVVLMSLFVPSTFVVPKTPAIFLVQFTIDSTIPPPLLFLLDRLQ